MLENNCADVAVTNPPAVEGGMATSIEEGHDVERVDHGSNLNSFSAQGTDATVEHQTFPSVVVGEEEAYNRDQDFSEQEQSGDPTERVVGGPGIGGSLPTPPPIPKRRDSIGAI